MKTNKTNRAGLSLNILAFIGLLILSALSPSFAAAPAAPTIGFDHLKTGFPLTGMHATARCELCHAGEIFKGTPKNCAGCHATGVRVSATPKPGSHVPTQAPCDYCHRSTTTFLGAQFNHTGISNGCATCHNGTSALGKSAKHFATASPCETCHKNTVSFSDGAMFNHLDGNGVPITSGCSTCHNGNIARGKSASHFPSSSVCESCHTNTTTFAGAQFDHTTVPSVGVCGTCHQGQYAAVVSKPASHIPTMGNNCDQCHTSTNSFKTWTMNHSGVTAPCASCHSGQYPGVVSKPSVHIATTAACDTCHISTTTFSSWRMSHRGITGNCTSCHTGASVGGVVVVGKPAGHTTTTASCENCHSSTTVPGGFSTWTMNHSGITSNCASCHTGASALGVTVVGKPAGHTVTTAPCESCHTSTTVPGGFSIWTMNHSGITANCASCHTGASVLGTTVLGKPAGHTTTTASCETCHTSTSPGGFATWRMNHNAVGVAGLPCNTCHYAAGPSATALGVTVVGASTYPPHAATPPVADCGTCHTGTTTFLGALFSHVGVVPGTCSNCHDGSQAKGKPVGHMVTAQSCDVCHTNTANYTSFMMSTFNHAGIAVGAHTCSSGNCHSGTPNGAAKPSTHISTTAACDTCHTNTVSFLGATMSHAGILANCASCHGGQYPGVVSKPAVHIPSPPAALTCETCHTSTVTPGGFATWKMNHTGITSGCATCHNGQYAGVVSKPAAHISTAAACESCHTSTTTPGGFATWNMNHAAVTTAGQCGTCHQGQFAGVVSKPANHIAVTSGNACDTCHTNTSPGGFAIWNMNHASVNAASVCGNCHQGQYPGVVAKPSLHVPVTNGIACDACHHSTTTPGGFATWTMNHAAVNTAVCGTCHNGSYPNVVSKANFPGHISTTADCSTCHSSFVTFAGATGGHSVAFPATLHQCGTCHNGSTAKGMTAGHIPVTSVTLGVNACDACHSPGNSTPTTFAGTAMVHSAVTGRCDSCHNGSYTGQGITLGAQAKTSISNHIPTTITGTLDCSTCHTTATATWGQPPEKMNHNGATTGCVTCHLTGVTYMGSMDKKRHNGASAAKDCSSAGCHKPIGSIGKPYNSWN